MNLPKPGPTGRSKVRYSLGYLTAGLFLISLLALMVPGGAAVVLFFTLLAALAWAASCRPSPVETRDRASRKSVTGTAGLHADAGVYAGGTGFPFVSGAAYDISFGTDGIRATGTAGVNVYVPFSGMVEAHSTGAGAVRTGGGVIGGGFGLEGAAEGMALAAVLNGLTSKTHNDCVFRFATAEGEATFAMKTLSPRIIDNWLAPVRVAARSRNHQTATNSVPGVANTAGQLERLAALHGSGALTDEEFSAHKAALLRTGQSG